MNSSLRLSVAAIFPQIISSTELRTFNKPSPAFLATTLPYEIVAAGCQSVWFDVLTAWDVIGAQIGGTTRYSCCWAAYSISYFDPWCYRPDAISKDLTNVRGFFFFAELDGRGIRVYRGSRLPADLPAKAASIIAARCLRIPSSQLLIRNIHPAHVQVRDLLGSHVVGVLGKACPRSLSARWVCWGCGLWVGSVDPLRYASAA